MADADNKPKFNGLPRGKRPPPASDADVVPSPAAATPNQLASTGPQSISALDAESSARANQQAKLVATSEAAQLRADLARVKAEVFLPLFEAHRAELARANDRRSALPRQCALLGGGAGLLYAAMKKGDSGIEGVLAVGVVSAAGAWLVGSAVADMTSHEPPVMPRVLPASVRLVLRDSEAALPFEAYWPSIWLELVDEDDALRASRTGPLSDVLRLASAARSVRP